MEKETVNTMTIIKEQRERIEKEKVTGREPLGVDFHFMVWDGLDSNRVSVLTAELNGVFKGIFNEKKIKKDDFVVVLGKTQVYASRVHESVNKLNWEYVEEFGERDIDKIFNVFHGVCMETLGLIGKEPVFDKAEIGNVAKLIGDAFQKDYYSERVHGVEIKGFKLHFWGMRYSLAQKVYGVQRLLSAIELNEAMNPGAVPGRFIESLELSTMVDFDLKWSAETFKQVIAQVNRFMIITKDVEFWGRHKNTVKTENWNPNGFGDLKFKSIPEVVDVSMVDENYKKTKYEMKDIPVVFKRRNREDLNIDEPIEQIVTQQLMGGLRAEDMFLLTGLMRVLGSGPYTKGSLSKGIADAFKGDFGTRVDIWNIMQVPEEVEPGEKRVSFMIGEESSLMPNADDLEDWKYFALPFFFEGGEILVRYNDDFFQAMQRARDERARVLQEQDTELSEAEVEAEVESEAEVEEAEICDCLKEKDDA